MTSRISAPQPSVVHLVTLFRQIGAGEIQIPAFQRDYVWTEKQIISLLDSVYESFPIGSLLFWRVESKTLNAAPREFTAFPDVKEEFPLNYVLDGMQRLTTLYGVFHFDQAITTLNLNVGFDLRKKRFLHFSRGQSAQEGVLPLSSLFSPKKLLEFQGKLTNEKDGDELLDSVLTLQAAFQEYMIPTVTIQSQDVKRVVGVFERVNSTGTRLNSVDFMRAITWSSTFDLSKKIAEVSSKISLFDWTLDQDTIVKCVAIIIGMDVSSESLVNLRGKDEHELNAAFTKVPDTLKQTAEFLLRAFQIRSPDVVSYEGQLLAAFLLCQLNQINEMEAEFVRWFWACGLNEQLRGKPDDYVTKLLDDWKNASLTKIFSLPIQANFTSLDFLKRRLQGGAAFTNTFKMLFAKNNARDLFSGKEIPSFEYLSSASTAHFISIFDKKELGPVLEGEFFSAKLYCNSIVVSGYAEPRLVDAKSRIIQAYSNGDEEVLKSQFISGVSVKALIDGDVKTFLELRSRELFLFSKSLLE